MRVHILHQGAFAGAVSTAACAAIESAGHEVSHADITVAPNAAPAFWPKADLHVLITGRPSQHLERLLDRSVVETGVPGATIALEHPRLRLGPLVDGTGACLGCMHTRRAQHDQASAKTEPLIAAYDADPDLEPGGYLPHHVSLATAWLSGLISAMVHRRAQRYAGRSTWINLHTGATGSDRIVGVHGCPRCRATPPLAESTWRELASELASIGGGQRG